MFKNIINKAEYLNKNIMRVTIKTNGRIHFISIYAPNIKGLKKEGEIFFKNFRYRSELK